MGVEQGKEVAQAGILGRQINLGDKEKAHKSCEPE